MDVYPETLAAELQGDIEKIVHNEKDWPHDTEGEGVHGSVAMRSFLKRLAGFQAKVNRPKMVIDTVEKARDLYSVGVGLQMWYVVLIGAMISTLALYIFLTFGSSMSSSWASLILYRHGDRAHSRDGSAAEWARRCVPPDVVTYNVVMGGPGK